LDIARAKGAAAQGRQSSEGPYAMLEDISSIYSATVSSTAPLTRLSSLLAKPRRRHFSRTPVLVGDDRAKGGYCIGLLGRAYNCIQPVALNN